MTPSGPTSLTRKLHRKQLIFIQFVFIFKKYFLYVNIKNKFLKNKKYIILMYFLIKKYFKK